MFQNSGKKCSTPPPPRKWSYMYRTVLPVPNRSGSVSRQTTSHCCPDRYLDRCLNANSYTVPHWYAMCRTQVTGAKRAEWVPWRYITLWYAFHKSARMLAKQTILARYEVERHGSTVWYSSLPKVLEHSHNLDCKISFALWDC